MLKPGNVFQLDGGNRANSRLANDAFRKFLWRIDLNSAEATELMFSCK